MKAAKVDVEVECQDLFHLPYANLSFDVCFSEGVMEHFSLEDFSRGLKEQLRVGKIVLLSVPLLHWFLEGRSSQGDELVMTKAMWIMLLLRCGWILDISFLGPALEEIIMIAAMSTSGASLRISKSGVMGVSETGLTIKV